MDGSRGGGYASHVSAPKDKGGGGAPRGYFQQSRDLLNSFLLVLPLLLVYQGGLILSGGATGNGADLTIFLVQTWGWNALLWLNGGLILVGLVGVAVLKKQRRFEPRIALPLALESTAWAFLCGVLITWVLQRLLPPLFLPLAGGEAGLPGGVLDRVCLALGAGVNEEFVFRLGMFGGLVWALEKPLGSQARAAWVGVGVSSVLFSLAHYLGPHESFAVYSFLFRFLAGAFFCGLFWFRGFAVAVYTHAIYDVLVMVVFPALRGQ